MQLLGKELKNKSSLGIASIFLFLKENWILVDGRGKGRFSK